MEAELIKIEEAIVENQGFDLKKVVELENQIQEFK